MSASPDAVDPVVRDVLEEAAAWHLLSRLFQCPSDAWRADVAALSREVADTALVEAARAALEEASEGVYHSVFGPGGPAPPREVSYHDSLELGSVMSSITSAYSAFGYRAAIADPPDHVAVQSGFLAFLAAKHAFALLEGDEAHVAVTLAAAHEFRTGHLAVYAERLAAILEAAPVRYLQAAARILAERVGPRPAPRHLPLIRPDAEDDSGELTCAL